MNYRTGLSTDGSGSGGKCGRGRWRVEDYRILMVAGHDVGRMVLKAVLMKMGRWRVGVEKEDRWKIQSI